MKRDCAQFIRFNDFKDSKGSLAREIMKEIPDHLTQYFRNADIRPNTRIENDGSVNTPQAGTSSLYRCKSFKE